ncbi:MAG TPA: amino acid permease [Longimicrobiales bacterium]
MREDRENAEIRGGAITAPAAAAAEREGALQRILTPLDGMAIIVGIVIGAGILRTPGLIAGYLGDARWILLMWVLGGVVAALSTMVFAEMAAMLPRAGGKYAYARAAFGDTAAFVAGWSEVLVTRGFSGAAKAVLIAEYLILLGAGAPVPVLAGVIVIGFYLLHLGGLRAGKTFQNWTTALKILVLLAIFGAAFAFGDGASWRPGSSIAPAQGMLLGFALAYQSIAFTYYGWEEVVKMAEEVREPGRNLPRILLGSAAAVAALYLLINVAFMHALTPGEMAGSPLVARDAVAAGLGDAAGVAITVAGIGILVSSLNVNFLAVPRVALGLARDGLAPARLRGVSSRGTPVAALTLEAALIFTLAVTGTFEQLIRFMMFCAMAVDGAIMIGLFVLRRRMPDAVRPYRMPGYPALPALVVVAYAAILAIIIATQPALALGGTAMLAALAAAGVAVTRWRARGAVAGGVAAK